ncbi:zinc-binding dehydrogenase [Sphingopyxis sp. PET50]|uniref:zinc-binding dehydrogenase n=1 Tax=Sphingopyxis sp. PET50 TaxID=2976533 RepID=UPI0028A63753|nr:zinc-binding dehydrogenase [Sphingopyxis sp. PET50]
MHRLWRAPAGDRLRVGPDSRAVGQHTVDQGILGRWGAGGRIWLHRFPERGAENIAAIDALAAEGRIRPHVHAALDLADWREGFAMLERREVVGKVVLKP